MSFIFADMPDWTNAVVRLPYPNWDSHGAACVTGRGGLRPRTTDVSRETLGGAYLPISTSSAPRPQEPPADCLDRPEWANAHVLCIAPIPDPARKRGPGVLRCRTPLPTAGLPDGWISAWFSELVELSLLLPMRRHREEGGISSRTRGDHVPVPSCGSSVSNPCRAGMDGDVPFVSGPTSCTACP